jgi:hypothetical protein
VYSSRINTSSYLNAKVGDLMFNACLDTGAEINIVSSRVATMIVSHRLGFISKSKREYSIETADAEFTNLTS